MAVFAVAVAAGDIIKYQSFVYGSFVWGIHVRYNKQNYLSLCYRRTKAIRQSHESTPIWTEGENSSETLNSNYLSCSYEAVPHNVDENILETLGVECEDGQDGNLYV